MRETEKTNRLKTCFVTCGFWRNATRTVNETCRSIEEDGLEVIDVQFCGGTVWTTWRFMILYR